MRTLWSVYAFGHASKRLNPSFATAYLLLSEVWTLCTHSFGFAVFPTHCIPPLSSSCFPHLNAPRQLSSLMVLDLTHHAASAPSFLLPWGILSTLPRLEVRSGFQMSLKISLKCLSTHGLVGWGAFALPR